MFAAAFAVIGGLAAWRGLAATNATYAPLVRKFSAVVNASNNTTFSAQIYPYGLATTVYYQWWYGNCQLQTSTFSVSGDFSWHSDSREGIYKDGSTPVNYYNCGSNDYFGRACAYNSVDGAGAPVCSATSHFYITSNGPYGSTDPGSALSLSANPSNLTPPGGSSTLNWNGSNVYNCRLSADGSGSTYAPVGSYRTTVSQTSSYSVNCDRLADGSGISASTTVTVAPPPKPVVNLAASPKSITAGQSSTLSWSSANATSCSASGAWSGGKSLSGSASTGILIKSQTYSLSCSGSGGSATASATVTVSIGASSSPPPSGTNPPSNPGSTAAPPASASSPNSGNNSEPTTQSATLYPISISFKDDTGRPYVTGLTIDGQSYQTDKNGQVGLSLPAGNYTVTVAHQGQTDRFGLTVASVEPGPGQSQLPTQRFSYKVVYAAPAKSGLASLLGATFLALSLLGLFLWFARRRQSRGGSGKSAGNRFQLPLPPPSAVHPAAGSGPTPHATKYPWILGAKPAAKRHSSSIAAGDSYVEPEDIFQEGEERLQREGLGPKKPPA